MGVPGEIGAPDSLWFQGLNILIAQYADEDNAIDGNLLGASTRTPFNCSSIPKLVRGQRKERELATPFGPYPFPSGARACATGKVLQIENMKGSFSPTKNWIDWWSQKKGLGP